MIEKLNIRALVAMKFANGSRELAVLDQASRVLAEARSLDEIKTVRDKAEAARTYVKAARMGLELQNRAAEVKLRAERKAGEFLKTLKLRGGNRKSNRHDTPLKLSELGISRDQSKRWQHVAAVSDADFSKYISDMISHGREITSAGLLRIAKKGRGTFRTVAVSPAHEVVECHAATDGPQELLEELMEHCRLLGNVLRPVYQDGSLELKRGEKRVVGRLIEEMSTLITLLQEVWPKSAGGT